MDSRITGKQKIAKIRALARECAREAVEQGATEVGEPLPGDWNAYDDLMDEIGWFPSSGARFRFEYRRHLKHLLEG